VPDHRKKSNKSVALGVEIAGSRATVALVDRHGRIRHRNYAKTLWGRPAAATLEPYLRAIEAALSYAKSEGLRVRGLGMSIPGTLDQATRRPLLIPTLPSLNDFPLCDLLEAHYNLPTQLYVDVDAALLGEYHFGAGKGFHSLLFLAVNAVVGAALVIDGKLERSAHEYVGHVCHMLVSTNGPRCSCGKRGCINTLVSMEAIKKMVQRALRRGEQTSLLQRLSNREYLSQQLLAEEAKRGDKVALRIYGELGHWLGAATARYMSIFEPNVLILGGGVLSASELLLSQVRSVLISQSSSKMYNMLEIVPSRLGADAALIGAAVPFFNLPSPHRSIKQKAIGDSVLTSS
jgi:glucokinase